MAKRPMMKRVARAMRPFAKPHNAARDAVVMPDVALNAMPNISKAHYSNFEQVSNRSYEPPTSAGILNGSAKSPTVPAITASADMDLSDNVKSPRPVMVQSSSGTDDRAAAAIQAIWRGKTARFDLPLANQAYSEPVDVVLLIALVYLGLGCLLIIAGLIPPSYALVALGVVAVLVAWHSHLMAAIFPALRVRVRRSIFPPSRIPLSATNWSETELASFAAGLLRSTSVSSGLGEASFAEESLADALSLHAIRIQAVWRGKNARVEWSERSFAEGDDRTDDATSPQARVKWQRAAQDTAKLRDVVSLWLSFVVPPDDKERIAKLPNKNRPSHYAWMRGLLMALARGRPPPAPDGKSGRAGIPLFVVAGACPSSFAGMQAVMYVALNEGEGGDGGLGGSTPTTVDFWWIKPKQRQPSSLERHTLQRNASGAPNVGDRLLLSAI